jgi:hypothetical protein
MQYRDKPKAIAHTGNVLSAGMIYDTAISVRDGFNIETAVGAQLDIIGKWLGVGRTITGTTFTRAYYGYALYGDTTPFLFNPMLLYGVEPPDAQFRDYKESTQSLYDLTDEEYRVILKLAIVRNTSNASVKTIDDILDVLFGAECYFIDRMNMTVVSYMVGEKWSRIFQIAKTTGLLPNPAGVGTALVVVPDINNIFSYSLYGGEAPSFAVGYASYARWNLAGNDLGIVGIGSPNISSMSSERVAFADDGLDLLRAIDFDGVNWHYVGNPLNLAPLGNVLIATLSPTRIALIDSFTQSIQAYDFDGVNWSAIGNPLNTGYNVNSLSALNSSRICLSKALPYELRTYDFDGTDWSLVGNPLTFTGPGWFFVTALDSSSVAFIDSDRELGKYSFDGTDWSLIGNKLFIEYTTEAVMTALTSSSVAFIDSVSDELRSYEFDGTDWSLSIGSSVIPNTATPSLTTLSSSRVAFIDQGNKSLRAYDLSKDDSGCMASYS